MPTPVLVHMPLRRRRSRAVWALVSPPLLLWSLVVLLTARPVGFVSIPNLSPARTVAHQRRASIGLRAYDENGDWKALGKQGEALQKELVGLRFEGTAADGDVVIEVDGQQRPVGVRLAEGLEITGELGEDVAGAYAKAVEESTFEMTRRLRELYANFFAEEGAG